MQSDYATGVKYLRRENGLPSGQIQGLTQDRHGRLWIATPSGLASFDGSRVHAFSKQEGLRSHGLRAVATAADGRIWVGSDAGYDLLDNGVFVSPIEQTTDWPYGFVECIHCTDDKVWLGTASGQVVYDCEQFQFAAHEKLRRGLISAVNSGPDGTVWVATADGDLLYFANGTWSEPPNNEWREVGDVLCLARGPANHIIIGGSRGFAEISVSGVVVGRAQNDADSVQVTALHFGANKLWASVGKQLRAYVKVPGGWRLDAVVLEGHFVSDVLTDQFDNVWAATQSHGIAKISVLNNAIQRVNLGEDGAIFAVAPGHRTGRIIAAGERTAWRVDHKGNSPPIEIAELSSLQIWDVIADTHGTFYAATSSGLQHIEADGTVAQIGRDNAVLSKPNRCLVRHEQRLYVGTLGGCAVVSSDHQVSDVAVADGQPIGYVYTLMADRTGRLWAGTLGNGLWVKDGDEFRRFEHELLSRTGNTYGIDARDDNAIAFVQDDKVCVIRPDGELQLLARSDDPIAGWTVRWAVDGSIWTGSASGLSQYNSQSGHRMREVIALLGLSNWEFTTSRSLYIDDAGTFYCGVNSGLLRIDAKALTQINATPHVKFGAAKWEQTTPTIEGDTTIVPAGRWTVLIDVFASWYIDEDDLQFRFYLSGFDEEWRALDNRSSIRFNSLPPGDYQLEAQAYNRLVGFGPVQTMLNIRVLKPRWANSIFMAPFTGVARLRRVSNALLRNRALNDRTVQLERVVQERTADLEQARSRLESVNAELVKQATTDQLTGISNRRQFDNRLNEAIADAAATGKPLSLILLDIDHFKPFNDLYGHSRGDDCLSFVARKLESTLYRPSDVVARYGGEEFAVILPGVDVGGAMSLAERLRANVEDLAIAHKGAPKTGRVTVSLGVTTLVMPAGLRAGAGLATRLIESADAALYEAKESGRNQCVFGTAPTLAGE